MDFVSDIQRNVIVSEIAATVLMNTHAQDGMTLITVMTVH
jgi:hypothetical protein